MFKIGDKLALRWDDNEKNRPAIRKPGEVVKLLTDTSPFWLVIAVEGEEYVVRGSDCSKA